MDAAPINAFEQAAAEAQDALTADTPDQTTAHALTSLALSSLIIARALSELSALQREAHAVRIRQTLTGH
jgi:hypothetical protein